MRTVQVFSFSTNFRFGEVQLAFGAKESQQLILRCFGVSRSYFGLCFRSLEQNSSIWALFVTQRLTLDEFETFGKYQPAFVLFRMAWWLLLKRRTMYTIAG